MRTIFRIFIRYKKNDMIPSFKTNILPALLLAFILPLSTMAAPFAVFNYKVFYTPDHKPMVETYFDISAQSIMLLPQEEGLFMGTVEMTIIFKKAGAIVTFDKKQIQSPQMAAHQRVDFIDVERFVLDPGTYEVEITLKDISDPEGEESNLTTSVVVPPAAKGAFFSDIEMVSALRKATVQTHLTKSGYDLVPMVADSVLKSPMKEIIFYTELYGMDRRVSDDMFLLKIYLKDLNTDEPVESTVKFSRENVLSVTPVLSTMDISDIPDGKYEITLEARDKNNELVARAAHYVHRLKADSRAISATIDDPSKKWVGKYDVQGVLYDYANSLRPIADKNERDVLDTYFIEVENSELPYLQRFFYSFWEAREPGNGEQAWNEYKEKVDFVNNRFSTANKRGYETDQGRIYLKYGAPNHIAARANEPGSYPYEIWQYYKTEQFNNVRFVFYDPTLLNREYELLHSEGVRGEIINPRWKYILQIRSLPSKNLDETEGTDYFGGRVDDYFENPR